MSKGVKENNIHKCLTLQVRTNQNLKIWRVDINSGDKLFIKFSEGELINPDNFPEHYFNKIILYNLDEFNLFNMLESVGINVEQITMEQLMEFLVSLGVQNLIVVDLSCSVFNGNQKFLSDRNIRQLRRNILFR